jgi:hypothetical protein
VAVKQGIEPRPLRASNASPDSVAFRGSGMYGDDGVHPVTVHRQGC